MIETNTNPIPAEAMITGSQLLGRRSDAQSADGATPATDAEVATFQAIQPDTGTTFPELFHEASDDEIDRAMTLAAAAHPHFEQAGRHRRAALLEAIAQEIEDLGAPLLERASGETGLPLARLEGERGRTCGQLRLFAQVIRDGSYLDLRIDHADPERQPIPKPDLRTMQRALGPVVVFGASNFPLAFSVAGGDTASALAAGCPVVVKAHPHHPGTSEMVGRAILRAVRGLDLPEGTFSLVQGRGHQVGAALVQHPDTRAVGFTGSLTGGRALFDLANQRPNPIPVYAEMGSTNPVFLLPRQLASSAEDLASGLAASITLGAGQFCTNPGIVVFVSSSQADVLTRALTEHLQKLPSATMLHAGIRSGFEAGVAEAVNQPGVETLVRNENPGRCGVRPTLLGLSASTFLQQRVLHEEVFGPCTMLVACQDRDEMLAVAASLVGQLTATVHGTDQDLAATGELLEILTQRVGRLLFGGYPTSVEVTDAMVHGGPYPATTHSQSTSVGTAAIRRFTRPVCWQNAPASALPEVLRDDAPAGLRRLVDGTWTTS